MGLPSGARNAVRGSGARRVLSGGTIAPTPHYKEAWRGGPVPQDRTSPARRRTSGEQSSDWQAVYPFRRSNRCPQAPSGLTRM